MFGREELNRLELRRRELVLRCSLNRLAMRTELQNLQTALQPAEHIISKVHAVRPLLLLLAPLAGILAARGVRHNGSGFSKVIGLLKWIRPLLDLSKQFRSPSGEPAQETESAQV